MNHQTCFHTSVGSGRTLRETVLESSPVLALLNQSFISSWSLVRELENMQVGQRSSFAARTSEYQSFEKHFSRQADEQNLSLSEKARLHLEKYSFPVEMMVALPNGTVVSWNRSRTVAISKDVVTKKHDVENLLQIFSFFALFIIF